MRETEREGGINRETHFGNNFLRFYYFSTRRENGCKNKQTTYKIGALLVTKKDVNKK